MDAMADNKHVQVRPDSSKTRAASIVLAENRMPVRPEPLRWARTLVLAGQLFFLLAGNGFSIADEGPASAPVTAEAPAPPTSYLETLEKSMDEAHASLERNILKQTIRFDDFFGNVTTENLRQPKYELRWRNSLFVGNAWDLKLGTSIRANFVLSRISERLRLVIAGEDEPGPFHQSLPQDPGNPGFDRTTPATHFANTELRYDLIRTPAMNLFLGAGIRLVLPLEAFVRSRFLYTRDLSDIALMRLGETFFFKSKDLLGETTEFSLERLIGRDSLLRWASAATASQEIAGLEWGSELSLIQQLSPRSAVTLTGGFYGTTDTAAMVGNSRLSVRYRQNFLRDWLFYELEPELSWPRDSVGRYPATLACTLRIEVVFQGTSARKENIFGSTSAEGWDLQGKRGAPNK